MRIVRINFSTLVATTALTTAFLISGQVFAADFIVDTASTSPNDGNLVDGNDSLTITTTGSITTTTPNTFAVLATNGANTLNNQGSITTFGDSAYGIYAIGDNNTVSNSGSITTSGNISYGIWVRGNHNTSGNSGNIKTSGQDAHGILALGDNNTSSNSGNITTSGNQAHGIWTYGINNNTSNVGNITTSGTVSRGLYVRGDNNTSSNSGSITTSGTGALGMYAFGNDNTFNVSGLVISGLSDAVRFRNGINTLNLAAPAYIGGAFDLGAGATLTLTSGPSHSVLWHFDPAHLAAGQPTLSGPVPWFVSVGTGPGGTDQYATYDPSSLAGQTDALGDMTSLISDATGQAECGSGVWVSAFGGRVEHAGNDRTLGRNIDQSGAAMGCSLQQSPTLRVGFKAGLIQSDTSAASRFTKSLTADAKGAFVGVSGSGQANLGPLGEVGLNFQVNAARLSHKQDRFVNNNLSTTGGLTLGHGGAESEFDSWFVAPEISMTRDLTAISGWNLSTDSSLRYSLQSIDEISETSTDVAAKISKRRVSVLETQSELQAKRDLSAGSFTAKVGLLKRYAGGDEASVTMLGQTHEVAYGDNDKTSVYVGAGLDLNIGNAGKLAINGRAFTGSDMTGYQGSATFKLAF
ncbi:MAG: autotransporter domain-containing protein [Alphaproteobacteria bacterium]